MFRKDRIGRRGGGVLLYIQETIPAYEVQLQEEADCKEAVWCNLVTGHTAVTIDDFRGACAVKGNVQVAGRTSSVSTTQMLSTHDVTLRNVDGSLFHVQI